MRKLDPQSVAVVSALRRMPDEHFAKSPGAGRTRSQRRCSMRYILHGNGTSPRLPEPVFTTASNDSARLTELSSKTSNSW